MTTPFRIGTRASALALWQANWVKSQLEKNWPDLQVELLHIKTTGDKIQNVPLSEVGGKGLFTKEIDEALLDGRVDIAVHSMKDVPFQLPQGIIFGAVPEREDPRDALIAKGRTIETLPPAARIGTSSLRRQVQLRHRLPKVRIETLRGNVDTRLRKLEEGQVDAILLAAAGLDRLEKAEWVRERFEPHHFCPAAGQGSLGIETRKDDPATLAAIAFLDDAATCYAVTAERAALAALGGGCQVPIGIHCRVAPQNESGEWQEIFGVVADPATGNAIRAHHETRRSEMGPLALGQHIANKLMKAGAKQLLETAQQPPTGASA
jgi:hydroxymethylbilane synthase